jgi:hypothetical protein
MLASTAATTQKTDGNSDADVTTGFKSMVSKSLLQAAITRWA